MKCRGSSHSYSPYDVPAIATHLLALCTQSHVSSIEKQWNPSNSHQTLQINLESNQLWLNRNYRKRRTSERRHSNLNTVPQRRPKAWQSLVDHDPDEVSNRMMIPSTIDVAGEQCRRHAFATCSEYSEFL